MPRVGGVRAVSATGEVAGGTRMSPSTRTCYAAGKTREAGAPLVDK